MPLNVRRVLKFVNHEIEKARSGLFVYKWSFVIVNYFVEQSRGISYQHLAFFLSNVVNLPANIVENARIVNSLFDHLGREVVADISVDKLDIRRDQVNYLWQSIFQSINVGCFGLDYLFFVVKQRPESFETFHHTFEFQKTVSSGISFCYRPQFVLCFRLEHFGSYPVVVQ